MTFEHVQGTEDILADHISRLRFMDFYDTLYPKEGEKELWHFMFKKLFSISMEQKESRVTENQMQHTTIKLDQEEIKRLQWEDTEYFEVIKNVKIKNKNVNRDFSIDPKGVLH